MIHHTELLRTNSDGEEQQGFSAPIGNYLNEVDCGIKALPCLTRCLRLEKCAKFGVFVTVLSLVGFFQGTVLIYFRGTSDVWSTHFNIPQDTVDWLIYTNEVFVGLFALVVAYWGNRIHRASWMGGLTIFLAISAATLAVPEIYNPLNGTEIDSSIGPSLCNSSSSRSAPYLTTIQKEFDIITFAILMVFQILFAMATVSFITHGVTYIDDHISPKHSPGFIGLALAAYEIGKQAGLYFSWAPFIANLDSIFISPVWIVFCSLTFIIGVVMAMFPKVLPNIVMLKSVNSLISLASGNNMFEEEESTDGFFKSLWRILKNKVLMLNILALTLVESALINFSILQKDFNQSKYHMPKHYDNSGFSDPFLIQFTTNLLRQPMIAVSLITSGMVIAKLRPKAKYLVIWNVVAFKLAPALFASTAFLHCTGEIENEHSNTITIPFCSSTCGCNPDSAFHPMCVDGRTFFSPCMAGCSNYSASHNIFSNCSCGDIVAEGSCDAADCKIILALFLANSIITSGFLATTLISSIVISLRSVSTKDRALALGLQYTFLGIIPYLPVRAVYYFIAETFCEIDGQKGCQFYSESFTKFLAMITILLMVVGSIIAAILLCFVRNLELYKSKHYASGSDLEINETINRTINTGASTADVNVESSDEDVSEKFLRRDMRLSEGRLNMPRPKSKEDRINSYLSEGDLVPPLKQPIRRGETSNSKTSGNSGLSTDSLKAIASTVGDDHDSDTFSESSKVNLKQNTTSPKTRRNANVVETKL